MRTVNEGTHVTKDDPIVKMGTDMRTSERDEIYAMRAELGLTTREILTLGARALLAQREADADADA
jgi:hypothetical protein